MALLEPHELRELIERLCAFERSSATPGERRAAELLAGELREAGARTRIEEERAHGSYWWPIGLLTGLATLAGLARGRRAGVLAGLLAAAAAADDVTGGKQWFRRGLLPSRSTWNVVGETGPEDAARTVVVVAHHDAAHSGLVFHPELPRALLRRFPSLLESANTTPGTLWGAVGGPLLVAFGALLGLRQLRLCGAVICAGYAAAMADIGARRVVPGANDNATGVAVLASLARSLQDEPLDGVRVLLLSTGSEESFMEGMQAFARRHFDQLPRDSTWFLCVDTVGSPRLLALEGEGMIWMNEYPKDMIALAGDCARELGIDLLPGLRLRNATDGLVPLRAGYPTLMLGSVDEFKMPTDYHWPTDTPDNVHYASVADAARLCRALLERLGKG